MTLAHGGRVAQMPASGARKALIQSGLLTRVYFVVGHEKNAEAAVPWFNRQRRKE